MQKKKLIALIAAVAVVAGLSWYVSTLMDNKGKSMSELISFAIEDTASIDRMIISEPNGMTFEIRREGKQWVDKDGGCIVQELVHTMLETIHNVEFKGYITENSREQHMKMLSAQAKKVEIYQDGDWSKTWYIGTPTPDHYGQVMLLDSEEGKSDLPVLMKIKGFNGIIEPRFFADSRKWRCTEIMALSVDQIKRIEYKNYEDPARSFSIKHEGFNFQVFQNGKELPAIDTSRIFRYMNNYRKVHFDMPNYSLSKTQVDSVKRSMPFASLKVVKKNGGDIFLKCFRIPGEPFYDQEFGEVVNTDANRFWCQLPSGELVKCQYFVFDPLFRGDVYFPFDKTLYKKKPNTTPQ